MAKMYVFRKLSELNRQQSDVCEEAISGVLDDVLKGKTSTIFNYGNWTEGSSCGDRMNHMDMMERTLNDLFSHVYTMEVTMEINISIRHVQRYVGQSQSVNEAGDCQCLQREAREHFVAATHDVYTYMEKVIGPQMRSNRKAITNDDYPYALFTICVRQTNLEQSMHLQGNLQLIQLITVQDQPEALQLNTPMASLLKIMSALATDRKTHLRYYNIRLTRILKDLLGEGETTVIFNYTNVQDTQLDLSAASASAIGCAKIWKALFMQERNKCNSLKKKILSLESAVRNKRSTYTKAHPDEFYAKCKLFLYEEQRELCTELTNIKADAEASFGQMLDIQHAVEQLTLNFEQNSMQLKQKNDMLAKLHVLLAEANNKLQKQRHVYQHKFAMYSEMFRGLWDQQRVALQAQEKEREKQISLMFDSIYNEMRGMQQTNEQQQQQQQKRHCPKFGR